MAKCDRNCFECRYEDCISNRASYEELKAGRELEREAQRAQELMRDDLDWRRRWELNNPKRAAENKHRHYMRNKEAYNERNRRNYHQNRDKCLARQKEYYQENKDIINVRNREVKRRRWALNPEYYRQKQREYRARKKLEAQVV